MEHGCDSGTIDGTVKWFDAAKGFGFVVSDAHDSDLLIHKSVLSISNLSRISDGCGIRGRYAYGKGGLRIIEVFSIEAKVVDKTSRPDQQLTSNRPVIAARVKWFSAEKGFGFASAFGDIRDIYIHHELVKKSDFWTLNAGEAVGLCVQEGTRGLTATAIFTWDFAVPVENHEDNFCQMQKVPPGHATTGTWETRNRKTHKEAFASATEVPLDS